MCSSTSSVTVLATDAHRHGCLGLAAEHALGRLGLRDHPLHEQRVLAQRRWQRLALEEQVDQAIHEVLAAQEVVACRGAHFHHALVELEDGDVEGAAAQGEYQEARLSAHPVHAVGQRRGSGFVEQPVDTKAGHLPGGAGGLALCVREIGRHGDDGLCHRFAERGFGIGLGRAQHQRGKLLGPEVARSEAQRPVAAHEALKAAAVRTGWVWSRSRAARPTSTVPSSSRLMHEGVSTSPRLLGMRTDLPSRQTATRLLVVPKSMPTIIPAPPCSLQWRRW
jgi:hypothetical protein